MDKEMLDMFSKKPTMHPFSEDELLGKLTTKKKSKKGKYMIATLITAILAVGIGLSVNGLWDTGTSGGIYPSDNLLIADTDNTGEEATVEEIKEEEIRGEDIQEDETEDLEGKTQHEFWDPKDDAGNFLIHYDFDKLAFSYNYQDSAIKNSIDSLSATADGDAYLYAFGGDNMVMPVILLDKSELQNIIPESFQDDKFIILRESFVEYDSIPDEFRSEYEKGMYIMDKRYPEGYFEHEDNLIIDWNNLKPVSDLNKRLYVSFTQTNATYNRKLNSLHTSPLLLMWDTYEKEINNSEFKLAERPPLIFDDDAKDDGIPILSKAVDLYFKLRNEMVPVKYRMNDSVQYVLWFIPTDEFIERLPERYRGEIREQYELFRDLSKGDNALGETCVKIEGRKDYFGICGERRGAIEEVDFTSITESGISSKLKLAEDRNLKIYISTVMGQIVHQEDMSLTAGHQIMDILARESLEQGAYFFVIETDKGEIAIEKIFIGQ